MNFQARSYKIHISQEQVFLTVGGKRMLLEKRANSVSVVWAGDLDGDGKLDFILDFDGDKSATTCLYLSGLAENNSLTKRVGCQFFSG
jgi:hypothetical protein